MINDSLSLLVTFKHMKCEIHAMVVSLHLESVCQTTTIWTSTKSFTPATCLSFASMVPLKPYMLKLKSGSNRQM